MLRHIALASLAMTAGVAFISTKVNAATLSIRSEPRSTGGEIAARRGDLIDIIFTLVIDRNSDYVTPTELEVNHDTSELSVHTRLIWLVSKGRSIDYPSNYINDYRIDIASIAYKVENPVRTRVADVWATLTYDDQLLNPPEFFTGLSAEARGPDVVPVPEPLTMFGAAAALGYGVIFKRKYSKNKES
jgi:hypothetical protein